MTIRTLDKDGNLIILREPVNHRILDAQGNLMALESVQPIGPTLEPDIQPDVVEYMIELAVHLESISVTLRKAVAEHFKKGTP